MEYLVFFEIFGKKLKSPVKADSPEHAIKIVREKLEIIKVEKIPTEAEKPDRDILAEILDEIFKKPGR